MERDFTSECYEDFCTLVNQIKDDNWCGVTDWFGDLFLSLKHLLQDWGWLDRTTEMETYYRELLDRKDASEKTVTQVFEDISRLDKFSSNVSNLGYFKKYLIAYRDYIVNLKQMAKAGHTGKDFSVDQIKRMMNPPWNQLQKRSLPLLPDYPFTASSFGKISNEEKEAFISRCENLYPFWAEKIDKIFSDPDLTNQEKLDIKFMIYSGPEPYRSIYLEHIDKYDVGLFQDKSEPNYDSFTSHFDPDEEKIWLTDQYFTFRGGLDSPYNTVFHESGHAIDYYERTTDRWLSKSFELDGKSLYDCIVADTRNYINDLVDKLYPRFTEQEKETLFISLNLSNDASFQIRGDASDLPMPIKDAYRTVRTVMFFDLYWFNNADVGDIYGGVTNRAIGSPYGHGVFEGKDYDYWYKDGETTKYQAVELWAEFFASKMTHDERALASIREHFPTAYPLLEEMALKMAPY